MTDEPKTDRLVGEVLDGRFRLDRLLGAGGMGKVYEGHQLSVERRVAVKVLREELSESDSLAQRFFREAKVVASLRHPNIVGLVDFGRDPDRGLYIAMEYIDGTSLSQLLARGRVEAPLAVAITRQICSALAEAHAAGVIHRDLKPDNVMLVTTAEGALTVKVLDFGIALPTGEEARLTSTGAVVGTPHYMAPEQAQDHPVTGQADLYSLGVMLYEMLTGRLPFVADTPMAVLLKVITQHPPELADVLPRDQWPPSSLVMLMDDMMAKDAADRPASVADVARRLDEIVRAEGLATPTIPVGGSLDGLVVERASDEFVFGETAASPIPGARSGPVPASTSPPITAGEAKIPAPKRRFNRRWLLLLLLFPMCCWCAWCLPRPNSDVVSVTVNPTPDVGSPAIEVAPSASADAGSAPNSPDLSRATDVARPASAETPPAVPDPSPRQPRATKKMPASDQPVAATDSVSGIAAMGKNLCTGKKCSFDGGNFRCGKGQTCTAKCPSGGCLQACVDGAHCRNVSCAGGNCQQLCTTGSVCAFTCAGGGCRQQCLMSTCEMDCADSGCAQNCLGDGCKCSDGDCSS